MICLLTLLSMIRPLQEEVIPSKSAEAVIEDYITAKGGRAALERVENISIRGEVFVNGKSTGKFEIYQATGRHLTINRLADGSVQSHGTDGKVAWSISSDGSPFLLSGQEARDYIRHYESLHESLEWLKQSRAIKNVGVKTIGDTPVHHLVFLSEDNRQISRYFSVETGLFIREEAIAGEGDESEIIVSEIGNYTRDASGVLVSRRRVNYFGSNHTVEYVIDLAEPNSISDSSIFDIPPAVLKLQKGNGK